MWKGLVQRVIAVLELHKKLLNIGSKNKYCLKLQQLSPSTANVLLTLKWSLNLGIISNPTFSPSNIPHRNVFSLGFNWILHYLLVGKRDAYCAHFWRKNWDIIIKVGREHENIGTKSATICIWLLIWTPWIFLDNILFGETQSPPWAAFFSCLQSPGFVLAWASRGRAGSTGSDTRLSSLQAEPAPHHTQIKTIPAPMAFAAGSKGNTGSCSKTKSQVFQFHTFPFLYERGTGTTPQNPTGQKPSQGPLGWWETLRNYCTHSKTKHFSHFFKHHVYLSPTKSMRGAALPWFLG